MATSTYTCCQNIRGFPSYIAHPGTVQGWPLAHIPVVRISADSQVTLYILGLSEDGHLHIIPTVRISADSQVALYILGLSEDGYCQSICGFPSYIVHPGTVRGWPLVSIPTVRVSADSQFTLYVLELSKDGHFHIYLLSDYLRIPKLHCTSWDCPRMATCIYTYCQSTCGFPSCIVHPGTIRGWPLAFIPTLLSDYP